MRVLSLLSASALGLSVALVAPASTAQAADLRVVASPVKVVVDQSYENVSWSIQGDDAALVDDAFVTLEHRATREASDMDMGTAGVFKFYDWEQMGTYDVLAEAHDSNYDDLFVASATVVIKRATRAAITGARQGKFVTLTARSTRYDGGYPLWVNHRGATVQFQQKVGSTWRGVASRTLASNGTAAVRVKLSKRPFRAVVAETAGAWGRTSAVVTR